MLEWGAMMCIAEATGEEPPSLTRFVLERAENRFLGFVFGCTESLLLHVGPLSLVACCRGVRGLFIVLLRLLVVVASLVVEHGSRAHRQ